MKNILVIALVLCVVAGAGVAYKEVYAKADTTQEHIDICNMIHRIIYGENERAYIKGKLQKSYEMKWLAGQGENCDDVPFDEKQMREHFHTEEKVP